MSTPKQHFLVIALTTCALIVLALIYLSPIWWVALTAPNYPANSFPDGVRIHFHMNGVFNGCQKVGKAEINEDEALDCVHEMNTINHYIGMYPIAAGAPLELAYAQFMLWLVAIMLVSFMIHIPKLRLIIMVLGFAILSTWMYLTMYSAEGIALENTGYLSSLLNAHDVEVGENITSLSSSDPKSTLLTNLRTLFEKSRSQNTSIEPWHGDGFQIITWHYGKTLGRYFNKQSEIAPKVEMLRRALITVFWIVIGAMLLLIWGAYMEIKPLYWLLVLAPMMLPIFFLIDYSAWLWWFGHNLNQMGAFSVKPFMPTVLGNGKVAQFTTHSYPYYGFGLMLLFSALLAMAAITRRQNNYK